MISEERIGSNAEAMVAGDVAFYVIRGVAVCTIALVDVIGVF